MKCIKCPNSASTGLKHLGPMCDKCFVRTIEKRIRKDLTIHKTFAPNDKVLLLSDDSLKTAICKHFLTSISQSIPLKIDVKRTKTGKYNKIVIPINLDQEIEAFLETLFTNKTHEKFKEILLLKTVSDEEISVLKRILKLKGTIEKTKLGITLDKLEKKYPGSKFGLFKNLS